MSKTYSAGIVTAYGAAKRAGYQGTYEDFCRQQAGYAESAAAVEQAKNTAVSAASTATAKAGEAATAATAAQTAKTQTEQSASQALTDIAAARSGAISAVQTEGQTQTVNARAQAQAAAQSATTASTKASEASASATSAGQSATNAAASATSAANAASAAQAVLNSIPEDYSDMSEDVGRLKADLADIVQVDYLFNNSFSKSKNISSGQSTNQNVIIESNLPCTGGSVLYVTYNANVTVNPNIFSSLSLQCVEFDANNNVLKRTFDFDNPLTLGTNTTHIALYITYTCDNTESGYTEIFTGNICVRNGDLTLNEDVIIPQISNMLGTDGEAW